MFKHQQSLFKKSLKTTLICFCFLSSLPAFSEQKTESKKHVLDQELNKCFQDFPGTTSKKNCIYKVFPKWEKRLQKYYLLLGGSDNKALYASQQAWINYRKKQEAYILKRYDYDGTLYRLLEADSRLELLRQRTLALEADYHFILMHR